MYSEYNGRIKFQTLDAANKARAILEGGGWVKPVEDKLAYVDDGNSFIDEERVYTPNDGLWVFLNGGVAENIHRAVEQMLQFEVDKSETEIAMVSFDGNIDFAIYNKQTNKMDQLEGSEIKKILGYDPFVDKVDEETAFEAQESGYDWVTEYTDSSPEVRDENR